MKTLSILVITVIALTSCGELEMNDPLTGNWRYESVTIEGHPLIVSDLNIQSSGDTYIVTIQSLKIDGVESLNYSSVVSAPVKGDKIGKLNITNGDVIIEFTNLDRLSVPGWYIDNVRMERGNQIYVYGGQSLEQR